MNRAEIAAYLRAVAERLDDGEDLRLDADGQGVTLSPSGRATFEVKVEREISGGGPAELSVEFESSGTRGNEETDGAAF